MLNGCWLINMITVFAILNFKKMVRNKYYSTFKALEISEKYRCINGLYNKFEFIKNCKGIKLIVENKKYWFEFYGKQITDTDFYSSNIIKMWGWLQKEKTI